MEEGLHLFVVVQQDGMLSCGTAVGRMAMMVFVISLEANVHRCVHCRLLDLMSEGQVPRVRRLYWGKHRAVVSVS